MLNLFTPGIEPTPSGLKLSTCVLFITVASVPLICSCEPVDDKGSVGGVKSDVYLADFDT